MNITLYANYSPIDETPDPRQLCLALKKKWTTQRKSGNTAKGICLVVKGNWKEREVGKF